MYSKSIKYLFALTSLSPILLTLWLVKIIQNFKTFKIYDPFESSQQMIAGTADFLLTNWELLSFVAIVAFTNYIINHAIKNLPPREINVKSIKPADINFFSILVSYILPWFKFFITTDHDVFYLLGLLIVAFFTALVTMSSYHYNLNVRLILGYNHYEIQTTGEVTYLMLSKSKLINKTQVKRYVLLADHMLINVS